MLAPSDILRQFIHGWARQFGQACYVLFSVSLIARLFVSLVENFHMKNYKIQALPGLS